MAMKKTVSRNSSELKKLLASLEYNLFPLKAGPSRKLSSEQEYLMTLMRLRLGVLNEDLAFRFQVSTGRVSQIVITQSGILERKGPRFFVILCIFDALESQNES